MSPCAQTEGKRAAIGTKALGPSVAGPGFCNPDQHLREGNRAIFVLARQIGGQASRG